MTKGDDSTTQDRLASLSRLQLQALCVKAGLDSTVETEELRRILREHRDIHGQLDGDTRIGVDQKNQNTDTGDIVMEDPSQNSASLADTEAQGNKDSKSGNVDIKLETEDGVAASLASTKSDGVKSKQTKARTKQGGSSIEVQDGTEVAVKQEEGGETAVKVEADADADAELPLSDVKIEETTTTAVAQRKQFWEAQSASTQSGRTTTTVGTQRNVGSVGSGPQKRARSHDDTDDGTEIKNEDNGDDISSSLPTPGTVRNLIGKFAGSTISSSEGPQSKKRKVDTPKSSPAAASAPTIPRYKKVIKIAAKTTSKNVYAFKGANRSGTGATKTAVGPKTRASSEPSSAGTKNQLSSSTSGTPVKKSSVSKPMSAETINRLATPKRINTLAASATGATSVAPSASSTAPVPTRPRGPVLSTASRAAQRRNREKK
ncbi:MAG: hypothetical protein J3Q66DRAFT_324621 [Benniella sp.]|nr:MAG: hypothetical protein J3Q66DRAFT_324621 [Benniella sp.]